MVLIVDCSFTVTACATYTGTGLMNSLRKCACVSVNHCACVCIEYAMILYTVNQEIFVTAFSNLCTKMKCKKLIVYEHLTFVQKYSFLA